ncbi:transposase [Escherichia coli]|nr:transposase [Escherichia coli]
MAVNSKAPSYSTAMDQSADQTVLSKVSSAVAPDGKVFTPAQLAMLLEGIDWRQPKTVSP